MLINIRGINKIELLKQLWLNSKKETTPIFFSNFFSLPYERKIEIKEKYDSWNEELAKCVIGDYIYYFQNRPIKCNLSESYVNTYEYNVVNGEGSFEKIINNIRKNVKYNV